MDEISSFFNDITVKKDRTDEFFQELMYLCVSEFGWTQEEFCDTDIPFLLDIVDSRNKSLKKQEIEARRRSKRG